MIAKLVRLLGGRDTGPNLAPLYAALVSEARQPHWYVKGGVADTIEGRFEVVSAVLAAVMARLGAGGEVAKAATARLAEQFVTDMEGQIREIGIGDAVIGKHMGKLAAALGGRLGAYRDGLLSGGDLEGALLRNLYAGEAPAGAALTHSVGALRGIAARLATLPDEAVIAGRISAA
jgi:cytochrome b pre-mRNA-processing protein 3